MYILKELLGPMIVEDVHVHSLGSAISKGSGVVFLFDQAADASNHHRPREDSLKVAPWHLQDQAHVGWHGSDQPCTPFDATASLVIFRVIGWHFQV